MAAQLDLAGVSEIAAMLGVSRQRVDKLSRTDPAFPNPVAEVNAGRIWMRADVERWIIDSGRVDQRPKAASR